MKHRRCHFTKAFASNPDRDFQLDASSFKISFDLPSSDFKAKLIENSRRVALLIENIFPRLSFTLNALKVSRGCVKKSF